MSWKIEAYAMPYEMQLFFLSITRMGMIYYIAVHIVS